MRLIPVLLPSLATAWVAPARPRTVTPARLAPLQAGAVADAVKLKVAPKLESPPVDSSGTLPKVNGGIVIGTRKLAVVTGASSSGDATSTARASGATEAEAGSLGRRADGRSRSVSVADATSFGRRNDGETTAAAVRAS